MAVVDVKEWKEFKLIDLFDLLSAKGDNQAKLLPEGDIPLVSAGSVNNGITARVAHGDGKSEPFSAGVLTTDMFGKSFYQDQEFLAVSHGRVNILTPVHDVSATCLKFVVAVLDEQFLGKYGFDTMCSQKALKGEVIPLPATPEGEPDWEYMEEFMCGVEKSVDSWIQEHRELRYEPEDMDVSGWKEFRVCDYFEYGHGSRLKVHDRLEGDLPFVTAGSKGQGVASYISNEVEVFNDPITVDMFGNCFYQGQRCSGDDNVYFFTNDEISPRTKKFIATAISRALVLGHNFASQFRETHALSLSVPLPATPEGEPDWEYMEDFMREVEGQVDMRVRELSEVGG